MSESNPYSTEGYMTYVVKTNGKNLPFNPKLTVDGEEVQIVAASTHHESEVNRRLVHLLGKIIWDHECIYAEYLNSIGFSREDADQLSMQIDGLENTNPPQGWENG